MGRHESKDWNCCAGNYPRWRRNIGHPGGQQATEHNACVHAASPSKVQATCQGGGFQGNNGFGNAGTPFREGAATQM
jgi:hypothetical protein